MTASDFEMANKGTSEDGPFSSTLCCGTCLAPVETSCSVSKIIVDECSNNIIINELQMCDAVAYIYGTNSEDLLSILKSYSKNNPSDFGNSHSSVVVLCFSCAFLLSESYRALKRFESAIRPSSFVEQVQTFSRKRKCSSQQQELELNEISVIDENNYNNISCDYDGLLLNEFNVDDDEELHSELNAEEKYFPVEDSLQSVLHLNETEIERSSKTKRSVLEKDVIIKLEKLTDEDLHRFKRFSGKSLSLEPPSSCDQDLGDDKQLNFVNVLSKYQVLLNKSQRPTVLMAKKEASEKMLRDLETRFAITMDEKGLYKKINNMKTVLRKKTGPKATGKIKIRLSIWEHAFIKLEKLSDEDLHRFKRFSGKSLEPPGPCDQDLDDNDKQLNFVNVLSKYQVLLNKSQRPTVLMAKKEASEKMLRDLETRFAITMDEKGLYKKINNMKTVVKNKTGPKATGKIKIRLSIWENAFLALLRSFGYEPESESNLTFEKNGSSAFQRKNIQDATDGCSAEDSSLPLNPTESEDGKTKNLENHIRSKQDRSATCDICGKFLKNRFTLRAHTRKKHPERLGLKRMKVPCNLCGKILLEDSVERHMKLAHSGKPRETFKCEECGKVFANKITCDEHIVIHREDFKPFECSHCGKTFHKKATLTIHQTIHTAERRFSCTECGRKFLNLHNMKVHQARHSTESWYVCDQCGRSFKSKGYLMTHLRVHREIAEKGKNSVSCADCGKTYKHSLALKTHRNRAHGDNSKKTIYKCSICEKTLSCATNLKLHENLHQNKS